MPILMLLVEILHVFHDDNHSSSSAQQVSKVVLQIIFSCFNIKFGTLWWDLCDRLCHIMVLKAVGEGSIAPNLRQSCAKYIGTLTKKNKNWFYGLKMPPYPQNQCWVFIWWLWVLGTQIWDNLNFLKKKIKNLIFLKKNEMKLFCLPPTPQYQCWPYPRSRTPYDQHW